MGISAFSGMRDAKGSSRGTYLEPGVFVVEVEKCHIFRTRQKEDLFIVELLVRESNNEKHPKGSRRNFVQKMNVDATLPQIKQFVGACLGFEEGSDRFLTEFAPECETIAAAALAPPDGENILKGKTLQVEVVATVTKEKGLPFNRHKFRPV